MKEKIKDFAVFCTYGDEDFNKSHPWYCVITVTLVIGAFIWSTIDLIWRWRWGKKNERR